MNDDEWEDVASEMYALEIEVNMWSTYTVLKFW